MFNYLYGDKPSGPYVDYGTAPYMPYEMKDTTIGPVGVNDASSGLENKFWGVYFEPLSEDIYLKDLVLNTETLVINEPNSVDFIGLAFDQSANDTVAFITGSGELKIRFFDSLLQSYETLPLGQAQAVKISMDMKYYYENQQSDILLFYIRAGAIFYRVQRDRYAVEYPTLITGGANRLLSSGLRKDFRFQVEWD